MRAAVHRRLRGPGTGRAGAAAAGGRDDVLIRVHAGTASALSQSAPSLRPQGPWQVAGLGIGTLRPPRRALGVDVAVAPRPGGRVDPEPAVR